MAGDESKKNTSGGDILVYLDIEIGDQEFKTTSWDLYRRGQAFFATHGALYGYDGMTLEQLGPEDRQNLQEIYDSNPALTKGGSITLNEPAPLPGGRLIIRLDTEGCPKTSQNFLNFVESTYTNKVQEATYVHTRFFRLIKDHIIQGGDFTKNDGSGGHSSLPNIENPKPFADERHGLRKGVFTKPGVLAMANRGKNTNGSQFFFTIGQGPRWIKALEGGYVAFGEVVEEERSTKKNDFGDNSDGVCADGLALLNKLNKIPTDDDERPIQAITIIGCGQSIVSSHFDLSHIPASEQPHILRDFFLVPNYLSEEEQDMLVAAATKKLKRALGKQVRYEDGHFDGVITRYRECSATDWGTTPSTSGTTVQQIDQEKNKNTNMGTGANGNTGRNRTSPNEIMQAVKQEFFPSHWKWVAPHILELEAGKGGIKPHVDHLDASGEVVAGLCLGSDAVMELIHEEDPHKHFRVLLPRGCFYFQRDSVRYHYRHGIPIQQKDHQFRGIIVPKDRRISIMLRNALEPQAGRTGVPSNHKM
ncbi:hypothetical protein BGX28_000218 [Mortierella sp. GBA30]|nr:hypothetical protein BGX28_000218 [Mortierella sp. GBA30]